MKARLLQKNRSKLNSKFMETTKQLTTQLTCQFCDTPIQMEDETDEGYEGAIGIGVYAGDESVDICEGCWEHYH